MTQPQLSDAELARVDASYEPFPSFAHWPQTIDHAELWDRRRDELREALESADDAERASAFDIALRATAFDTGAIEGLYRTDRGITMTVATQAAAWEQALEPDARELFEAQLEAYELVLDVATRRLPVTEAWIRRLHEVVTAPQRTYRVQTTAGAQHQPLAHGAYKSHPNHVRLAEGDVHAYAPVVDTAPEMHRLVTQLESPAFAGAHRVVQASYVHYALAAIHPFGDGNGRVARAVASVYFYRALSVPLMVLADRREEYLRSLQTADKGDRDAFVSFVAAAGRETMALVTETLKTARAPHLPRTVNELRRLMVAQGGLSHSALDAVANDLVTQLQAEIQARTEHLELPEGVRVETGGGSGDVTFTAPGFRHISEGGGRFVPIYFQASAPAEATVRANLVVLVSTSSDEAETFRIQLADGSDGLTLGLNEVRPALSMAGQLRLQSFVDRMLGRHLTELYAAAARSLRESGYARGE